jgi:hypothetical protein
MLPISVECDSTSVVQELASASQEEIFQPQVNPSNVIAYHNARVVLDGSQGLKRLAELGQVVIVGGITNGNWPLPVHEASRSSRAAVYLVPDTPAGQGNKDFPAKATLGLRAVMLTYDHSRAELSLVCSLHARKNLSKHQQDEGFATLRFRPDGTVKADVFLPHTGQNHLLWKLLFPLSAADNACMHMPDLCMEEAMGMPGLTGYLHGMLPAFEDYLKKLADAARLDTS